MKVLEALKADARAPRPAVVHTPTLLQMETVECGAAALGIVLAHHGRHIRREQLREDCVVTRDGSNAANLVRAARRHGLLAKGFRLSVEKIQKVPGPVIVFWQFNHFLVVEGFTDDAVHVNDPAFGHRVISHEEFDEGFTGVSLLMEPGPDFERVGTPPRLWPRLLRRLKGSRGALGLALGLGVLLTVPRIGLPVAIQRFIDHVVAAEAPDPAFTRMLLLLLAGLVVAQVALGGLQRLVMRRLRHRLTLSLTTEFVRRLLRLPARFFSQRPSGEVTHRIVINYEIANFLAGQLALVVIDAAMMVLFAAYMLTYDVFLTLIGFAFAGVTVVALQKISAHRHEANARQMLTYDKASGTAVTGIINIETIQASALDDELFVQLGGHYATAVNARQELARTDQQMGVLPPLLKALAAIAILAVGGLRVMDGNLTLGALVAFLALMVGFLQPIDSLVNLARQLQELAGRVEHVEDVLQCPEDASLAQGDDAPSDRETLVGHVELEGVSFGFSRSMPPLLEGLSLGVPAGTWLGIVGPSGSGKSSIVRLLTGLEQPWAGEVRFDSVARPHLRHSTLARSVALVDQHPLLFEGTVRENLTLWDPTISDAELEDACRAATILDTILALPGAFDGEVLDRGTNLSGGERQRLDLARALVRKPSVLILDEATSGLDAETEAKIISNLRARSCTCVIVTHRLSTIRGCDDILVLEAGRIAEQGTHEELWQRGGIYRELIEHGQVEA